MNRSIRIIPRLDIKGPNLVKGIHLEGLRVLGKPEQFSHYYYGCGADELLYIDVVASLYSRNSLDSIITKTAKEIFIPLTVGGGLRTIEDIRRVLKAGADKVSLNTAALKNPNLIRDAAREFGSSTIVISIEAIRQLDGTYFAYTDNGREYTGVEVLEWSKKIEDLGAGEILLTSVDREGTGQGYDIELTRMVTRAVSIPVIACGGASEPEHLVQVIKEANADAIAIASMLHYDFIIHNLDELKISFVEEGNVDFLTNQRDFSGIKTSNLLEIKDYLSKHGIHCRFNSQPEVLK